MKHLITTEDLPVAWLDNFLTEVHHLKQAYKHGTQSEAWEPYRNALANKILVSLFYEPSTRTRLSFESAMTRLGGSVIGTEAAGMFSSAVKGETLEDTIRVCGGYGDILILRHKATGSARLASAVSTVPVINAGDGQGEHPTQALLDYFTIWENFKDKQNLSLTVVGDLKRGRTIHSLLHLVSKLCQTHLAKIARITLVAPADLALPKNIFETLKNSGVEVVIGDSLNEAIMMSSDIFYTTRTQAEREDSTITSTGDSYVLTDALAAALPEHAIILHPLPRNQELPTNIDTLPQAKYFTQAQNGLFVRMTLLLQMLHALSTPTPEK